MTRRGRGSALYELMSSMRFAVSLLTALAIASIIGTVLKQAEPYPNYVSQFRSILVSGVRGAGVV